MRKNTVAGGIILWGLLGAGLVQAGIYSTSERWIGPKSNPEEFFLERAGLRGAGVEVSNRLTAACWTVGSGALFSGPTLPLCFIPNASTQLAFLPEGPTPGWRSLLAMGDLERRQRLGRLSRDEAIDLSAVYLRLGQPRKAIALLEPQVREERHFMLLANLATAYEQEGLLERTVSYRQLALASWPLLYPGWSGGLIHFSRRAERAHLQLAQLRLQESQRGQAGGMTRVDALYPRIQFLGPSGQYEAGTIASVHGEELTEEVFNTVMQLVLWMPFDDRLYWLFGEMLNARGDVVPAFNVLNELVTKRGDPRSLTSGASPELRRHWQVLSRAAEATQKLGEKVVSENDPYLMLRYAFAVKPRGLPGVPVVGDLVGSTDLVVLSLARKDRESPRGDPNNPMPAAPPEWMPQWRQITVGFGFGAIVALLAVQQLRQVRRGRTLPIPSPSEIADGS